MSSREWGISPESSSPWSSDFNVQSGRLGPNLFCSTCQSISSGECLFTSFLIENYLDFRRVRRFFGEGVHFKLERTSCWQSLKYTSLYNTEGAPFSSEERNMFLCN